MRQRGEWLLGAVVLGLLFIVGLTLFSSERLADPPTGIEAKSFTVPQSAPLPATAMVFSDNATGSSEIYVQTAGGERTQITDDEQFDSWRPRLSPDRATILYYRTPAGMLDSDLTQAELFMASVDGQTATRVIAAGAHGWTAHTHAEWAPNGVELVMAAQLDDRYRVVVTSANGVDVRTVMRGPGDSIDPSWSPDGRRITYAACVESPCIASDREVFVVPAAGGPAVQVTDDDVEDREPRFSPSGNQMVVRSWIDSADGGVWDVRIATTNTSRPPRRLGAPAGDRFAPVWVDANTVAFHEIAADGSSAILEAAIDSGQTTTVLGDGETGAYLSP